MQVTMLDLLSGKIALDLRTAEVADRFNTTLIKFTTTIASKVDHDRLTEEELKQLRSSRFIASKAKFQIGLAQEEPIIDSSATEEE
jgi:hypothetical protein